MKKLTLLLSITSFLLISCTQKQKTAEASTDNVPVVNTDGMKIAYYVQDSLKSGYSYYAELDSIVKIKQLNYQKELQKRESALQNYAAANEEKASAGLLSAFDIQKVQEEIQRRQQSYMQYQETEGARLEQETGQHLEVLSNRISDAAKKFCKENNIDILLMQGMGAGVTYISEKMDVTNAFVQYLNKYQAQLDKEIGNKK